MEKHKVNWDEADPYKLAQIESESRQRAIEFQNLLLDAVAKQTPASQGTAFFLATRELYTELQYGFITNMSKMVLRSVVPDSDPDQQDVISLLRNRFSDVQRGFLAASHQTLRNSRARDHMIFLKVDNGNLTDQVAFDKQGLEVTLPEELRDLIGRKELESDLIGSLEKFSDAVKPDMNANHIYLVLRPDASLAGNIRRQETSLLQVGAVFSAASVREDAELKVNVRHWAMLSSIGTYNLLYEKERYYAKGIRQAAQGFFLKAGSRSEIKAQIRILDELNNPPSHATSVAVRQDPMLDEESGANEKQGWYRMPRYTMPQLQVLFTSTSNIQDFEVVRLTRSCLSHLERHFWKQPIVSPLEEHKHSESALVSVLGLAVSAAREAQERIESRWQQLQEHETVMLREGLFVGSKQQFQRAGLDDLLNQLAVPSNLDIVFHLNPDVDFHQDAKPERMRNPVETLLSIKDLISEIPSSLAGEEENTTKHPGIILVDRKEEGRLHGDPHFANLLVDASIPEDPFIVAIDPMDPYWSEEFPDDVARGVGLGSALESFKFALKQYRSDPGYDVAKMLASCVGLYSLVYQRAYQLDYQSERWTIKWADGFFHSVLTGESGGISSASLVKLDVPVVRDAWRYHVVASREIIAGFQKYLADAMSTAANCDREASISLIMIRTWLYTIRHGFSLAGKLFPTKAERSMILYMTTNRLLQRGVLIIGQLLEKQELRNLDSLAELFAVDDS